MGLGRLSLVAFLAAMPLGCRPAATIDPSRSQQGPSASAFVVRSASDLLEGPAASGAIGDVRMQNGQVVAVIAAAERAVGFAYSGGNLVDLARVGREDHLNQVFLYLDDHFPRQGRYSSLQILEPGGPGRRAVVRAKGVDSSNAKILVETDYVLDPGSTHLTLVSRFTNTSTGAVLAYEMGDAMQWGRSEHLAPGHGFEISGRKFDADWIAGLGRESSYAIVGAGPRHLTAMNGSVWSDAFGEAPDLAPGQTVEHARHIVVGFGDTASMMPDIFALRGDSSARFAGRVTHGGVGIQDAEVHVRDEAGALTGIARADASGAFSISVRPGKWSFSAYARGRDHVPPLADASVRASNEPKRPVLLEIKANESKELAFEIGPRASITFEVMDAHGAPLPSRVTFVGVDGTETPDLGPFYSAEGARNVVLSKDGRGEVPLGKGRYRVIASRGPEYEIADATIDLGDGQRKPFKATLVRTVDTIGYISTDTHQHSAPSMDSGVSLPDRVISNAVEGVELLVATDHNVFIDHGPTLAALGLERWLKSSVGTEATTHSVGHFNAFPMVLDPADPRGGMKDVEGMTPTAIFDFLADLAPKGVTAFVQVNHPRAGEIGYFDLMQLDPQTGLASDTRFDDRFDAIELVSFRSRDETDQVLADWFALLGRGQISYAVGSSDSHTVYDREVGWPRSFVCSSTDDPWKIDPVEIANSLATGCASVSAGAFVTIEAEAKGAKASMGKLLRARDGKVSVRTRVQAPSWIPTDRLVLYKDGQPLLEAKPSGSAIVRFDHRFEVSCDRDCFVLALVDSPTSLAPIMAKGRRTDPKPLSLTNPIFIDVDGDGKFRGSDVPPVAHKKRGRKG
ncbi:MAG: CehA/McbA family metallohydrolase [Deltaproteobacteria bacterium]|nr:CehA/McbA family metallohydrolase [Deltaproteobacteria bacterium]